MTFIVQFVCVSCNMHSDHLSRKIAPKIARRFTMRGKIKIVGSVELSLLYMNFSKKHPDAPRLLAAFEKGLKTIQSNGTYARIRRDFNERLGLLPQHGK